MNRLQSMAKGMERGILLLLKTVAGIVRVLLYAKRVAFDESEKKKSVCILGNGPSLAEKLEDKSFFRDKEVMCVNFFALSADFLDLRPRYYAMADPAFFFDGDFYGAEQKNPSVKKMMEIFQEKVNWKMEIFIPSYSNISAGLHCALQKNENLKIRRVNGIHFGGMKLLDRWLRKRKWVSFPFQNVLILGMVSCIYMKYKTIYLLGADHDWIKNLLVTKENRVCIADTHFYHAKEDSVRPLKKGRNEYYTMAELCRAFQEDFSIYEKIQVWAKEYGCHIINTNPHSFIDSFDKELL